MQNKIIKLFVTFVVLCSLQGFSQTADKSEHPLLDKYYPQKQNSDTNKTVVTQIKPVPESKPVQKIVPAITSAPATTLSSITTEPSETKLTDTTTAPVQKLEPVITSTPVTTTLSSITTEPSETKLPVAATTPVVTGSAIIAEQIPEKKKVQNQQPPPPAYMDTRLGSSTRQYDTWENNNNGAGSVTTSPK